MNWNVRTYLRLFLVVGGVGFLALGLTTSDTLQMVLGLLAVLVGGAGLVHERRGGATKN